MFRHRLAVRRLPTASRVLSTSPKVALPPRRVSSGGATAARTRVELDELGRERRALPPLGRDGKPRTSSPPPPLTTEPVETPSIPRKDIKPILRASAKKAESAKTAQKEVEADDDGLDWANMTPLEKAIRQNLKKYPNAILLTQVGSFYESYFEQARTVCNVLGIKLTSKPFGCVGATDKKARHSFGGFPLAQLSKQVSVLVEAGHKVVIVEEYKERGNDTIRRKVSRVVTPGTGVDESFVSLERMNYVLALGVVNGSSTLEEVGMAYRDISTGASFTRTSKLSSLRDDIRLVQPKEVVIEENVRWTKLGERIIELLEGEQRREGLVISQASTEAIPSSSTTIRTSISAAEDVLLSYLANVLVETPLPPSTATFIDPGKTMQLDAVTLQSLEIRESLRGGSKGSLLGAVKKTVTPGGLRLLSERLCNPSTDLSTIRNRHDLVTTFLERIPSSRPYLSSILRDLDDTPRLLQRLAFRRAHPAQDLLGLKRTMRALDVIHDEIGSRVPLAADEAEALGISRDEHAVIYDLLARLGQYRALADEVETAVDEEALEAREKMEEEKKAVTAELGETAWKKKEQEQISGSDVWGENLPWVIRSNFSPSLDKLHYDLDSLRQDAARLQSQLSEKYQLKSLTLRKVAKVGPGVHVISREGLSKIEADPRAMLHQKNSSTRVYVVQEWVDLHMRIIDAQEKILDLEGEAMQVLVARVLERYTDLLRTADALAELDVSLGFAEIAEQRGWVRPEVNESKSLEIVGGRHPTVENVLLAQNRKFDANDICFAHPDDEPVSPSLIHVLTGPNMAGKSTYLRQTALTIILAQAGSYVPALGARIGAVDRVFSRVGARDELDRDRSTFMVEMDEATSILEGATDRSLVLLDELGRGTSPLDGVSIAYAALEHLTHVNRSRTLFATHFHRLGPLLGYDDKDEKAGAKWDGVEFWCTDVEETEDSVRFTHLIRRGLNVDSGGLTIARMAGMPTRTILKAREVRDRLRKGALEVS
ncbi:hypothetical protein JCM11641_006782 [Rhodosporidiobolus odoratus]